MAAAAAVPRVREGTFERVGGQRQLVVDVRVVAAATAKLAEVWLRRSRAVALAPPLAGSRPLQPAWLDVRLSRMNVVLTAAE